MKNSKLKATCLFASLLLALALMTGCKKEKTPVTLVGFESAAAEKGYIVQDATDFFSAYDYIKVVTLASPQSRAFQIEYYELNDEAQAKSFYDNNKSDFIMLRSDDGAEENDTGENYDIYKLEVSGRFMMIERIDNTVIYVHDTDAANRQEIESFLKEIIN